MDYSEIKCFSQLQSEIGDTVSFGNYHGSTEWVVLGKTDSRLLLISKRCLDVKAYHYVKADVTWEKCSLRKWLNSDFIEIAFSPEEAALIAEVQIPASGNRKYGTDGGSDTLDRVFLLSVEEVEAYFYSDSARIAYATPYADGKRVACLRNSDPSWWLRTPGKRADTAAFVAGSIGGVLREKGQNVDIPDLFAVRPALWIDLSKIE